MGLLNESLSGEDHLLTFLPTFLLWILLLVTQLHGHQPLVSIVLSLHLPIPHLS